MSQFYANSCDPKIWAICQNRPTTFYNKYGSVLKQYYKIEITFLSKKQLYF